MSCNHPIKESIFSLMKAIFCTQFWKYSNKNKNKLYQLFTRTFGLVTISQFLIQVISNLVFLSFSITTRKKGLSQPTEQWLAVWNDYCSTINQDGVVKLVILQSWLQLQDEGWKSLKHWLRSSGLFH